jgi:chromate transporter
MGMGAQDNDRGDDQDPDLVPLLVIVREWTRLGCTGFGGPPAHIALLRKMCVEKHRWMTAVEFEDATATTNLLPGPASTQLAIFCAWKLRGPLGALLGGLCFIVPGLLIILGLSAVVLAKHPPLFVLAGATGAGAVAPAVALSTSRSLAASSRQRMGTTRPQRLRFFLYAGLGLAVAASSSPLLVLVIVACGLLEIFLRRARALKAPKTLQSWLPVLGAPLVGVGGLSALAWVALKVGALSYGGGFVIIPMMQHDAVSVFHWMTAAQFLNAVALGQVTPGPVVQTVAVVGYAAHGVGGGLLASAIAFTPSFLFVLIGARHFQAIRINATVGAFLTGAGPTVIGAIAGAVVPLTLGLSHLWQIPVLCGAVLWLMVAKRGVISCFAFGALAGVICQLFGLSL